MRGFKLGMSLLVASLFIQMIGSSIVNIVSYAESRAEPAIDSNNSFLSEDGQSSRLSSDTQTFIDKSYNVPKDTDDATFRKAVDDTVEKINNDSFFKDNDFDWILLSVRLEFMSNSISNSNIVLRYGHGNLKVYNSFNRLEVLRDGGGTHWENNATKVVGTTDSPIVNYSNATFNTPGSSNLFWLYYNPGYAYYILKASTINDEVVDIDGIGPSGDSEKPTISIDRSISGWTNNSVELRVKASDNVGIDKVVLPDGSETRNVDFNYTVYENNDYSFTAYDTSGNYYTETIRVDNIDKDAPVVSTSLSPDTWTNSWVGIDIQVTDILSGISSIVLPDGTSTTSSYTRYYVDANGDYEFVVYDLAGNSTTKIVSVGNIDKDAPVLRLSASSFSSVTNSIDITAEATDVSGVEKIVLPDGTEVNSSLVDFKVYTNGIYEFIAVDSVGNSVTEYIEITEIPSISLSLSNNTINFGVVDASLGADATSSIVATVSSSSKYDIEIEAPEYIDGGNVANRIPIGVISVSVDGSNYVELLKGENNLLRDRPKGDAIRHSLDFRLSPTIGSPSDSYEVSIKVRVFQS